jgi:PAS domain S-box-containing protein
LGTAVLSADLNGVITSWDKGAASMFGYTAEEIIGRPGVVFAGTSRLREIRRNLARIRRGESIENYIGTYTAKDGRKLRGRFTANPIIAPSGEVIGVATTIVETMADQQIAEFAREMREREDVETRRDQKRSGAPVYGLTSRELTVLELLVAGDSDREIAEVLGISVRTAQNHLHKILEKMDVASRTQAGIRAVREGLA